MLKREVLTCANPGLSTFPGWIYICWLGYIILFATLFTKCLTSLSLSIYYLGDDWGHAVKRSKTR